jgi:hypothetical protein
MLQVLVIRRQTNAHEIPPSVYFPYPRLSVAYLVTDNALGSEVHYSNWTTMLAYAGALSHLTKPVSLLVI